MICFLSNFFLKIYLVFIFFIFFIWSTSKIFFPHFQVVIIYRCFEKNILQTIYNILIRNTVIVQNYSYYYPIFDKTNFWFRYVTKEKKPLLFIENYGNVSSIKYDLTRYPINELNLKNSWIYSLYELLNSITIQPAINKINFFSKFLYFNPNIFIKNRLEIFSSKIFFTQPFYLFKINSFTLGFNYYFNLFFLILIKSYVYLHLSNIYIVFFLVITVTDYIFIRSFFVLFFFLLNNLIYISYKIMFTSFLIFDINYIKMYQFGYSILLSFKSLFKYLTNYFYLLFRNFRNFLQILIELFFPKLLLYLRSPFFYLQLKQKIDDYIETWFPWKP